MYSDLRYVVRSLARNQGFTAVVVLTLALGMGSGAAIFSVADWVLFRATDFPAGTVLIGGRDRQGQLALTRVGAEVRAYRELTATFSDFALGRTAPAGSCPPAT